MKSKVSVVGAIFENKLGHIAEVIGHYKESRCRIKFLNTGSERVLYLGNLRKGEFKDLYEPIVSGKGFLGDGRFRKCTHLKYYTHWAHMLGRCYDDRDIDQGRYFNVEVAPEWLNFQNFALWCEDTYPKTLGEWCLDKDYYGRGSDTYSPENCTWLLREENTSEGAGYKNTYWMFENVSTGEVKEVYNLTQFAKSLGLHDSATSRAIRGQRKSTLNGWVFVRSVEKLGCPTKLKECTSK